MGHQQKLGSYGKNRIFWPKTEILGQKKGIHFCSLTMIFDFFYAFPYQHYEDRPFNEEPNIPLINATQ